MCEILSKRLKLNGIKNEFIIGDLPQTRRLKIMNGFKAGRVRCLIATDVAARGIDVNDLAMVVNYDLPNEAENYVHRIGRTARAGKSGKAYSFCSEQDVYSLMPIERYIGKQIPSRLALQEELVEDKSRNSYIRLDSEKRRDDRSDRDGKKRRDYGAGNSRGRGKTARAAKLSQSQSRLSKEDELAKLSGMTSEERMQYYKEKYSARSDRKPASGKNSAAPSAKNSGRS